MELVWELLLLVAGVTPVELSLLPGILKLHSAIA